MINRKNIRTVTEINKEIQSLFDKKFLFVRIAGEISNLHRPISGHLYFSLKDENAQIRAVLFKNYNRFLKHEIKTGQQVICDGRITLYSPRGDYQIVVESVDFHGVGNLQIAFSRLKEKLLSEGLFDSSKKLLPPDYPERLVLITSPTGAAVHDFLSICRKRNSNLTIQILPVKVQGEGAAEEISIALEKACTLSPDAIVICRGGGSIEDLWCFNEEIVARAIQKANIPIITGIGHETDYTIADFCADSRCATPTAAAELLVPETEISNRTIQNLAHRLSRALFWRFESIQMLVSRANRVFSGFDSLFYNKSLKLDSVTSRLVNSISISTERNFLILRDIQSRFENNSPYHDQELYQYKLQTLHESLIKSIRYHIDKNQSKFHELAAVLDSVSPLATLARGYSITSKRNKVGNKTIITSSKEAAIDEKINVKLMQGELDCIVFKRS